MSNKVVFDESAKSILRSIGGSGGKKYVTSKEEVNVSLCTSAQVSQADTIISENIVSGIDILGVNGNYEGSKLSFNTTPFEVDDNWPEKGSEEGQFFLFSVNDIKTKSTEENLIYVIADRTSDYYEAGELITRKLIPGTNPEDEEAEHFFIVENNQQFNKRNTLYPSTVSGKYDVDLDQGIYNENGHLIDYKYDVTLYEIIQSGEQEGYATYRILNKATSKLNAYYALGGISINDPSSSGDREISLVDGDTGEVVQQFYNQDCYFTKARFGKKYRITASTTDPKKAVWSIDSNQFNYIPVNVMEIALEPEKIVAFDSTFDWTEDNIWAKWYDINDIITFASIGIDSYFISSGISSGGLIDNFIPADIDTIHVVIKDQTKLPNNKIYSLTFESDGDNGSEIFKYDEEAGYYDTYIEKKSFNSYLNINVIKRDKLLSRYMKDPESDVDFDLYYDTDNKEVYVKINNGSIISEDMSLRVAAADSPRGSFSSDSYVKIGNFETDSKVYNYPEYGGTFNLTSEMVIGGETIVKVSGASDDRFEIDLRGCPNDPSLGYILIEFYPYKGERIGIEEVYYDSGLHSISIPTETNYLKIWWNVDTPYNHQFYFNGIYRDREYAQEHLLKYDDDDLIECPYYIKPDEKPDEWFVDDLKGTLNVIFDPMDLSISTMMYGSFNQYRIQLKDSSGNIYPMQMMFTKIDYTPGEIYTLDILPDYMGTTPIPYTDKITFGGVYQEIGWDFVYLTVDLDSDGVAHVKSPDDSYEWIFNEYDGGTINLTRV